MSDITVSPGLTIPDDELTIGFSRSGGPGGQNVNKVSSKVDLRWSPGTSRVLSPSDRDWLMVKLGGRLTTAGELIVTSELSRDQITNRGDAEDKLATIVREALVRPKPRKKTRPSRGAKERRIQAKKGRAVVKSGRGKVSRDD